MPLIALVGIVNAAAIVVYFAIEKGRDAAQREAEREAREKHVNVNQLRFERTVKHGD